MSRFTRIRYLSSGTDGLPGKGRTILAALFMAHLLLTGCAVEDTRPSASPGEVSVREVARLGGEYPAGIGDAIARVSRLRDGRFLASSHSDRGEVASFDDEGMFIRRFGGYGDGPGEFRAPAFHWLAPSGDTLVVLDPEAMRVTRLSPHAQEVYETSRLPIRDVYDVLPLPDGTILINGPWFTNEGAGLPLHLLSRSGEVVRSFGSEAPLMHARDPLHLVRFAAISLMDPATIWVAHTRRYRLELWDVEGALLESFEPDVPWFTSDDANRPFPKSPSDAGPKVGLNDIWQDAGGLLWVIIRVPNADWRQRFEPVTGSADGSDAYRRIGFDEELWSTRINVWDPSDWTLVADTTVESMWFAAMGDGFAYSRHLDEQGVPYMTVWSAEYSPLTNRRQ